MKRMNIYIALFLSIWLIACSEENGVGSVDPLTPDYILPQGKSPADNRIVELYNQYGTYILYEYTERDFNWSQMEGSSSDYTYTKADPLYAGEMLDLLNEVWFSLYPVDFHRKYMPYKIFLATALRYGSSAQFKDVRAMNGQIAVSYCSDTLKKMSVGTKLSLKINLQQGLWEKWIDKINFPEEFFALSDYSKAANTTPSSPDYARNRGFVANNGNEWSTRVNWPSRTLNKMDDLKAFLNGMVGRTSEQWESDLEYPLVKKKYDILRNYLLETYDFDIQVIGDMIYK